MTMASNINTSTTRIFLLVGTSYHPTEFKTFEHPIETTEKFQIIHFKHVKLNGRLFTQKLIEYGTESITTIKFESVFVDGKIGRTYLPNLESFSCNGCIHYGELKERLYFNKSANTVWDWPELWNLGIDIYLDGSIRLVHSTKELLWNLKHYDQVLAGCKNELEHLTLLQDIEPSPNIFPTRLTYLKLYVTKSWEQLEDCINQITGLKELHITIYMDETNISKLPTSITTLTLIGESKIHFTSGVKLLHLDKLAFIGVTLSSENLQNIATHFNTSKIGFLKRSGTYISYENLDSILKMSQLEYIFIKPFKQDSEFQDNSEVWKIVQMANLYKNSEGMVLQKDPQNGNWNGHRLYQREESYADAMFANDLEFKFDTCTIKCEPVCDFISPPPNPVISRRLCLFPNPIHPSNDCIAKSVESSPELQLLACAQFGYECRLPQLEYEFFKEFFKKAVALEKLDLKQQVISKIFHCCSSLSSLYSKDFEARRNVPFDLSWIPLNVKSLVLDNVLFEKGSTNSTILGNLALKNCFLERKLFDCFSNHFLVKQIAISTPALNAIECFSIYLKDCENGIADLDFNDPTVFLDVNQELLYYLLQSETLETIVLVGFVIKSQCRFKDEIAQFLASVGINEWETSFILQKRHNIWKGRSLSGLAAIQRNALNAECLPYLMIMDDDEQEVQDKTHENSSWILPDKMSKLTLVDYVLDGTEQYSNPKPNPTPIIYKGPPESFNGFPDASLTSIYIENLIIDAREFTLELHRLNPSNIVNIELRNVELYSAIGNVELPNVRKFKLDVKQKWQHLTQLPRNEILKEYLFFMKERTIEEIFKTTDICLRFDNETYLEIDHEKGKILSRGLSYYRLPAKGPVISTTVNYANEILANALDENINFLHVEGCHGEDELKAESIPIVNNLKKLNLLNACGWSTTESILQKTSVLQEFVCSGGLHEANIKLDLFPKSLEILTIEDVNWGLASPPTLPINLELASFISCTFSPDFPFQNFFNVKKLFFLSETDDRSIRTRTWQTIQFLESILESAQVEFIYFNHFVHKVESIAQRMELEMLQLTEPDVYAELKLSSIDPVESSFLQAAGASQWDSTLTLIKKHNIWKCVHFIDIPECELWNLHELVEYTRIIYENACNLGNQWKYFDTLVPSSSSKDTTVQSIKMTNVALNASHFIEQLRSLPDAGCQLKYINLHNVKLLGDFPTFNLTKLNHFSLNIYPSDKLSAEIGATWKYFKPLLFFHGARGFKTLWNSGINVSISIGHELLFDINHSNQSFISRIENSNEILVGLDNLSRLGLNCKINPVIRVVGLRILRLEYVAMSWTEVETVILANRNTLIELHFSPQQASCCYPKACIILGKLPKSLRVLSLGNVEIGFDANEFKTLVLDTLILSWYSFSNCKNVSRNFSNYFNVERLGSFGGGALLNPYFTFFMLIQGSRLKYIFSDMLRWHCPWIGNDESVSDEDKIITEKSEKFMLDLGVRRWLHVDHERYNLELEKRVDDDGNKWIAGPNNKIASTAHGLDFRDTRIGNNEVSQLFRV